MLFSPIEIVLLVTACMASAIATHLISVRLDQGSVRASAGISLIVALLVKFVPDLFSQELSMHLPLAIMGATFCGMSKPSTLSNLLIIGIAGSIFGVLYLFLPPIFEGYGGKLGTAACVSVIMVVVIPRIRWTRN